LKKKKRMRSWTFKGESIIYRIFPSLFCVTDPTYIIQVVPSNASGSVYYTLLTVSVVHGAMAGYIGHKLYKSTCQHKTNLYTLYMSWLLMIFVGSNR